MHNLQSVARPGTTDIATRGGTGTDTLLYTINPLQNPVRERKGSKEREKTYFQETRVNVSLYCNTRGMTWHSSASII